jgi:hypothetical protein
MANGTAGTANLASPVLVAVSTANVVPPTASVIKVAATNTWKTGAAAQVYVAPNSSWGGTTNDGVQGSLGTVWPVYLTTAAVSSVVADIVLESGSIYWASSAPGGAIAGNGWVDAVNAN